MSSESAKRRALRARASLELKRERVARIRGAATNNHHQNPYGRTYKAVLAAEMEYRGRHCDESGLG